MDELVEIAKEPSLENTVTSLDQANTLLTSALNEVLNLFYSTSQRHVASDLFSKTYLSLRYGQRLLKHGVD